MNLFQHKNKKLLYVIMSPTSYLMLGHYRENLNGQIVVSYETGNETAVNMIKENKDHAQVQPDVLQEQLKLILKDVVKVASSNGVKVPGMDQMKQFFKI